jgi:hypothetical protein
MQKFRFIVAAPAISRRNSMSSFVMKIYFYNETLKLHKKKWITNDTSIKRKWRKNLGG